MASQRNTVGYQIPGPCGGRAKGNNNSSTHVTWASAGNNAYQHVASYYSRCAWHALLIHPGRPPIAAPLSLCVMANCKADCHEADRHQGAAQQLL